jgi:hypothetical protein
MPSTPSAYPQVMSRRFSSFRVVKFHVSAAHTSIFATGSIPGSSTKKPQVSGAFGTIVGPPQDSHQHSG